MNTIAVIRLGRLGDVALTGPTVKNLHFRYPGSKVLFITRARYAPLAAALPGVDRVLTFPDNGNYLDLVRLSSAIEECRPDLVVDLHKNFRSFHLATLTKAPYRVVYRKRRKERLAAVDDKKFVSPIPHTCDLYNGVVGQLNGTVLARRPDLMLTEAVLQRMLRDGVAIVPGASFPVKAWPANRFAQLAERIISDFQLTVRVFLGEDEGDLQHAFAHLPRGNLEIHHNRPLAELTGELSRQQLTISNDSGLMHVSSAVGTPTAALFGPTHEQLGFYPLGLFDRMIDVDEPCRPCSLHGDKPCSREEQFCFTRLTVDDVYRTIAEMLDRIHLTPAVFIDRDGTLIEDKHYLADPAKIAFLPGGLAAVAGLKKAGYKIVVISNQSGVARGFFPVTAVDQIHQRMREIMRPEGAEPDDIRFCPHHPDGDDPAYTADCPCRKPRAGMLEEAALHLGIDLKRSFIVGDKESDLWCGSVVGARSLLVRTGEGRQTEAELPADKYLSPYHICDDLAAAVDYILSKP